MFDLDLAKKLKLDGKPASLKLQWINNQSLKQECLEVNMPISGVEHTGCKPEHTGCKPAKSASSVYQLRRASRQLSFIRQFAVDQLCNCSSVSATGTATLSSRRGVKNKADERMVAALTRLGWQPQQQ